MSELIDNRRHRLEALKGMIFELHAGAAPETLTNRFRAVLDQVGASEISALESELMAEGMPESEIRRMCDLHVAVFRDTLAGQPPVHTVPGHPVHTFTAENQVILEVVAEYRRLFQELAGGNGDTLPPDFAPRWRQVHARLALVEAHYKRKEYLVFPFLERAGITAPPKVMWGVDDDIRDKLRAAGEAAADADALAAPELALVHRVVVEPLLAAVEAMVEKEDRVLWPMALQHLSDTDWSSVRDQWGEFGAGLVPPGDEWQPAVPAAAAAPSADAPSGTVTLPSGQLTAVQLAALLDALPVDITFVDATDRVAYFSEGKDRIFTRNRAILGRRVQDCHPPASLHIVQRVVDELRSGQRQVAEFWIQLHGRFVHIRYLPVRDPAGNYLGIVEMTQDVTAIRTLQGERRLLDEGGTQA